MGPVDGDANENSCRAVIGSTPGRVLTGAFAALVDRSVGTWGPLDESTTKGVRPPQRKIRVQLFSRTRIL